VAFTRAGRQLKAWIPDRVSLKPRIQHINRALLVVSEHGDYSTMCEPSNAARKAAISRLAQALPFAINSALAKMFAHGSPLATGWPSIS